jgi:hypothetical protein
MPDVTVVVPKANRKNMKSSYMFMFGRGRKHVEPKNQPKPHRNAMDVDETGSEKTMKNALRRCHGPEGSIV